jgi:hypothetical protein
MFIVVFSKLFVKKFRGMTIFPFIFLREKSLKENPVIINHEKIHLRQQLELLVLLFYLWYFLEYLVRLIQYKNSTAAYLNISFEKESYANEADLDYLKHRKFWAFLKFL